MKILTIGIAILLFTCTTNAQITKGNWMVGGDANYNNYSNETTSNGVTKQSNYSNLSVSPTVGYFVIHNFACGLASNFGISMPAVGNNITSYGIGPFARFYILKPEKTINILTQISYYYGLSNSDFRSNNLSFKGGPVVYLNKSVGLEFTINYSISNNSTSIYDSTTRNFNVGFGFQIHLEKNNFKKITK